MIVVRVVREGGIGLEVEGHANYDEYGKDIVCASISVLVQVWYNAVKNFSTEKILVKEKGKLIAIDTNPGECMEFLFDNLLAGIYNISKNYPNHVKVKGL